MRSYHSRIQSSNHSSHESTVYGILSTLLSQLSQHYQERLDRVILFGSYARGEATSDSDIDVLVILEEPVDATVT